MSIELTPKEIKYISKQVTKLQKRSKHNRVGCWIMLLGSAMLFTGAALKYHYVEKWREVSHSSIDHGSSTVSSSQPSNSAVISEIAFQATFMRIEMIWYIGAIFSFLLGTLVLSKAIMDWNKHHFYSIIAKLLHEKLEEIEGRSSDAKNISH